MPEVPRARHGTTKGGPSRTPRCLSIPSSSMAAFTPQKSTGTRHTASAAKKPRSSGSSRDARGKFVVCLSNEGYGASLEARKIYRTMPDAKAEKFGMVRVVDESGEGYLYPKGQFGRLGLPVRTEARAGRRHYLTQGAPQLPPSPPRDGECLLDAGELAFEAVGSPSCLCASTLARRSTTVLPRIETLRTGHIAP